MYKTGNPEKIKLLAFLVVLRRRRLRLEQDIEGNKSRVVLNIAMCLKHSIMLVRYQTLIWPYII